MTPQRYLELTVASDALDVVVDALWQLGAAAVAEAHRGDTLILQAGFADDRACDAARLALAARFDVTEHHSDGSELDAWRPFAVPVKAGRRVVVCPAWCEYVAGPGECVIVVDPGRTFGLGHPSTIGALAALEHLVTPGMSVLDVGSGSGVLAVGAARLGAARVDAIDVDAEARRTTVDNATRNGVADVVVVRGGTIDDVEGHYDLVVANLLLPVIEAIGAALGARVRRGGHLVLAGLLVGQDARARRASGLTRLVARTVDGGWVTSVARHSSAA